VKERAGSLRGAFVVQTKMLEYLPRDLRGLVRCRHVCGGEKEARFVRHSDQTFAIFLSVNGLLMTYALAPVVVQANSGIVL
jgi:hypothetical protein